jgi:hypothetical protein
MWRVNDAEYFESPAKIKNLQLLIELHTSLMNALKRKGTEQRLAAHRNLLEMQGESTRNANPRLSVG